MKQYGKKVLFWMLVVAVSAGVSFCTFRLMRNTEKGIFGFQDEGMFAKPVGYDMVVHGSGIQTDFTKAAEMTVNAVVHIKSTITSNERISGDPFFDLFFGNKIGRAHV